MGFENKVEGLNNGTVKIEDFDEDELSLLYSTQVLSGAMKQMGGDVAFWTKVGGAIGASFGFMLEMAATGKIGGSSAAKITKGVFKATKAINVSTKVAKGVAGLAGKATSASIRTLAMPTFYSSTTEKYASGQSAPSAIVDGYLDTYTSVLAESLGGVKVGNMKKIPAITNFFSRAESAFGNVVDVKSGVKAFATEYAEEVFEGVANGLRYEARDGMEHKGIDEYLTDYDNHVLTAATVGVMTLGGGSVNTLSKASTSLKYNAQGKALGRVKKRD
jgi:hypothetical protein